MSVYQKRICKNFNPSGCLAISGMLFAKNATRNGVGCVKSNTVTMGKQLAGIPTKPIGSVRHKYFRSIYNITKACILSCIRKKWILSCLKNSLVRVVCDMFLSEGNKNNGFKKNNQGHVILILWKLCTGVPHARLL